ncbi:MAG TPA: sensor histidine kinase [Ktedonobacterales bacterium]|nr:sensor histidine kinase [Ktedonobacterales bacterium]
MQKSISTASVQRLRAERGWTLWLIPKRVDLVTSAFYLSMPIFFWFYSVSAGMHSNAGLLKEGGIIGATLILLGIDRLEYWCFGEATPTSKAVLLLAARVLFIEIIAQLDSFKFSPFLYFTVPLFGVLYFGDGAGYALAALAWMVYVIKHIFNTPGWLSNPVELQYFFAFTLGLVFSITMAQLVNRERASRAKAERLLAELAVSHQQLKDYTGQAVELAAAKERNRLAREIHDSLGHYLTVINVQLEKALAFHNTHPQLAVQAVRAAKGFASDALQDVRRSVSALRAANTGFSAHAALGTLIEQVQGSQLTIEFQVAGSEEGFSEESLLALYRAAQEGLTNVQKHARATNVRIELQFGKQEAMLHLHDNGQGFDPAILHQMTPGREGGYGLQGVQERLELIGGEYKLESAPGAGTRLTLRVPKAASARD